MRVRDKYAPEKVLADWRTMNGVLTDMNEAELLAAIKEEASRPPDERRKDVLYRLHRRYCRVRQAREIEEYMA